jgi:SAM-dependent methyltransferase
MTDAFEWQGRVGEAWAEERLRTDRSLAPVQQALLETLLPLLPPEPSVLDIGCGAGSTSLALADARPDARVTGLDLSDALIAAARERSAGRAEFEVGDASAWTPADNRRFDALFSRHGIMFFDDPVAAFAHIRGLARPGAPFVFSCFRARDENDWAAELLPIMQFFAPEQASAPPSAQGPFAFADPDKIRMILERAGFVKPGIEPLDCDFVTGAGEEPVAETLAYFSRIGPFA